MNGFFNINAMRLLTWLQIFTRS